jgi:hypothetical protein
VKFPTRGLRFCASALFAIEIVAPRLDAQAAVIPNQLPLGTRVGNLAINGAIGAMTGLVWATIRNSSKWRGIEQGAAGGLLMSVGKQTAASDFDGSGFVGREVSAVGVSLAASTGQPHTTFAFPIGPVSLEYGEGSYDWRLNVTDFVAIVALGISSKTDFDLHRSLSSGAAVFRDKRAGFGTAGDWDLTALSGLGTIRLSRSAFKYGTGEANVVYHENVHILQDDYFQDAIALPPERALIEHLPFGHRFLRHFDLGAVGPILESGMEGLTAYRSRPWEQEAYALTADLDY